MLWLLFLVSSWISWVAGFQIFVQEPVFVNASTVISWQADVGDPTVFGIRQRLTDDTFRNPLSFSDGATTTHATFPLPGLYVVEIISTTPSVVNPDTVYARSEEFSVRLSPSSSIPPTRNSFAPSSSIFSSSRPVPSSIGSSSIASTSSSDIPHAPISLESTPSMTTQIQTTTEQFFEPLNTSVDPSPSNSSAPSPSSGLTKAQIAVVSSSIGAVVLTAVIAWFLLTYWRKRHNEKRDSIEPFYVPPRSIQRTPSFLQPPEYDTDVQTFDQYVPEEQAIYPTGGYGYSSNSQVSIDDTSYASGPLLRVPSQDGRMNSLV